MRLIDADEFVRVINIVAEKEGGMNKGMEYLIDTVNLMPSVTLEVDGLQLFRDYMELVSVLSRTVEKWRGELSIADIKGMVMLENFENILRDLERKGYVNGKTEK